MICAFEEGKLMKVKIGVNGESAWGTSTNIWHKDDCQKKKRQHTNT